MTRPLNGCMCQEGTCESCNRVVEAWDSMYNSLVKRRHESADVDTALRLAERLINGPVLDMELSVEPPRIR